MNANPGTSRQCASYGNRFFFNTIGTSFTGGQQNAWTLDRPARPTPATPAARFRPAKSACTSAVTPSMASTRPGTLLASPDAAYITGQNLVLDGGQTLGIPGSLEG